jgi:adenylate cyclase
LEVIERNRIKTYKEDEAERNKLMEDIIRIYEKIKNQDGNQQEMEKRFNVFNERILRFKNMVESKR